jgi:hypothetical protein
MNNPKSVSRLIAWTICIATANGQTLVDLRTQGKSIDFSSIPFTRPLQMGTALPGACLPGQLFFLTNALAGSNLYACNPSNVWTVQSGSALTVGGANQVAYSNGVSLQWTAFGGDIAGPPSSVSVTKLSGRVLSNVAPSNGQALVWNGTWQPGGAGGDVSGTLTAATVTGIQSRPVSSAAPANGQTLMWNSGSNSWQPATVSGAIATVFGRSGAVTAQSGDYNFSQISGSAASAQLPAAGGDLSGTLTSAKVAAMQGRQIASTAPSNGQALVWSVPNNQWQPGSVAAGGGISMASQAGDLAVSLSSPNVLSIGPNCAPATPCNVRVGYQVFNITAGATATLSGSGTGAAYIYLTNSGSLVVGHNLNVVCAGCTQQSGVTSFPANVIPFCTWTATSGTWDTGGGHDQRAFQSAKVLAGGQGILITETPAQSLLAVDNGVIPTYLMNSASLTFPSIAAGACAPDQTIAVTGANTGDSVAPAWPAALPAGLVGIMTVSNTNTVTVRLCNLSASAVQPPGASYKATIVRNY